MPDGTVPVVAFAAVGGILFGLDQGNWGGAIVKDGFVAAFCVGSYDDCHDAARLPVAYARFLSFGSLLQLGAAFGALVLAPFAAGRYGRQEAMFTGSLVAAVGYLSQGLATQIPSFLVARALAGVGVGIVTYALPMFISEIAPAEMRGMLGCFMQLTMVFGMLIASMLNCMPWWPYSYSFALPAFPAMIVASGIFFFPTSPRFALIQGQRLHLPDGGEKRAWKSLRRLRGSDQAADTELSALKYSLASEHADAAVPWSSLWETKSIQRRVLVANMLQWMQQFTGVNAILSYGPAMFQSTQVPLDRLACAVIINLFNLFATVVMMMVIDRLGRRTLLLYGAAAMCIFMFSSAAFSHEVAKDRYTDRGKRMLGWCILASVCGYMFSFAVAWGGVPWVYPSEIFPMSIKEKALSTSVCSQWTANFIVAFVVPQQVQMMAVTGTFLFYSCCLAVTFVLVHLLVPETKGLELEEMEELFGDAVKEPILGGRPAMVRHAKTHGTFGKHHGIGRPHTSDGCPLPPDSGDDGEEGAMEGTMTAAARAAKEVRRASSESNLIDKRRLRAARSHIHIAPGGFAALY